MFCRRTLSTLIVNTVENVENKILEVLDVIGERVSANSFHICIRKVLKINQL